MNSTTSTKRRMARKPQATAEPRANTGTSTPTEAASASFNDAKRPSKADNALALLQREGGATLDELVEAT